MRGRQSDISGCDARRWQLFRLCGHAHHGDIRCDIFVDHGSRTDHRVISDGNVLQDGNVGSDEDCLADLYAARDGGERIDDRSRADDGLVANRAAQVDEGKFVDPDINGGDVSGADYDALGKVA